MPFQLESTAKAVDKYHTGAVQIRNKLKKLKATHRKITESMRCTEILVESSAQDAAAGTSASYLADLQVVALPSTCDPFPATESLNVVKQKLADFDAQIKAKGKTFKVQFNGHCHPLPTAVITNFCFASTNLRTTCLLWTN